MFDGNSPRSRTGSPLQDDRGRAGGRTADLDSYGDVLERDGDRVKLRVPKADTPRRRTLLSEQQVVDLTIEDPPIEDVIELVFAEGSA